MPPLVNRPATVVISELSPLVEGGKYPTKRVAGENLRVEADIFKEGHDQVLARLIWRKSEQKEWQEKEMNHLGNDRWFAELQLHETGRYEIGITAWADDFLTWLHDFDRRLTGDQTDFSTEIEEGRVAQASRPLCGGPWRCPSRAVAGRWRRCRARCGAGRARRAG